MNLFYVIGIPASGKTTLIKNSFNDLVRFDTPVLYNQSGKTIILGDYTQDGKFLGTDRYSWTVQPKVIDFISKTLSHLDGAYVVGEGDRLANNNFFEEMALAGVNIHVILLHTSLDICDERRNGRSLIPQDPTWLRGRLTKVKNLWNIWGNTGTVLDGNESPEIVSQKFLQYINSKNEI